MSYKLVIYENFFLNLCGAKVRFFFELCKKNRQLVRFFWSQGVEGGGLLAGKSASTKPMLGTLLAFCVCR